MSPEVASIATDVLGTDVSRDSPNVSRYQMHRVALFTLLGFMCNSLSFMMWDQWN